MRDASKARGVEHTGVFERRATPLAAMHRRPNARVIWRRALRVAGSSATIAGNNTSDFAPHVVIPLVEARKYPALVECATRHLASLNNTLPPQMRTA